MDLSFEHKKMSLSAPAELITPTERTPQQRVIFDEAAKLLYRHCPDASPSMRGRLFLFATRLLVVGCGTPDMLQDQEQARADRHGRFVARFELRDTVDLRTEAKVNTVVTNLASETRCYGDDYSAGILSRTEQVAGSTPYDFTTYPAIILGKPLEISRVSTESESSTAVEYWVRNAAAVPKAT